MSTVNGFQVGNEVLKYNYESLENYNTPNFSTSSSTQYAVGDYVTYQGKLYKCTTATTGGTWVSGSWELAILSDDLQSLGSEVEDLNRALTNSGLFVPKLINGYLKSDGTLQYTDSAESLYFILDVSENDKFRYFGHSGGNAYSIVVLNANNEAIQAYQYYRNSGYHDVTIQENGTKAIFASIKASGQSAPVLEVFKYETIIDTIYQNKNDIDIVESDIEDLSDGLDVVNDSIVGIFDGSYGKPILWLEWENGGITLPSGVENNNNYSIRSSGFVRFDNDSIWVQDPNGENLRLTTIEYQQDGTYVNYVSLNDLRMWKRIIINTAHKYRFVLYDTTNTSRATADTFSARYKYQDFTYVPTIVQEAINLSASANVATLDRKKADISSFVSRRPLVTIVDDDGYIDFYERLFDENGEYLLHAPICTAMEALKMGTTGFMTATQLSTVVASGCEILGHGYTPLAPKVRNPEANPITIEEAEADVVANLEAFHTAGFNPVGYVYPSGATNVEVREMIAKYYAYAMTTVRHVSSASPYYDRLYNFNCIPHYAVNRAQLFNNDNTLKDWSQISSIVSDCVENNGWLVLYTHLHKDTGLTATASTLNTIIDNIISAGADIVTATEAFNIFRNAWQAGDYLGPWNTFESWGIEYETHTANDAGCAVNMIGQWDMPSAKQIS